MILCLRTDAPTAEVYCYDSDTIVAQRVWEAHRTLARDLFKVCQEVLDEAEREFADLDGIVVLQGPGSFTGLRIGCSVANAIAYSENLPIVGTSGGSWAIDGVRRIKAGDNDHAVMPDYGAPPRITTPKK